MNAILATATTGVTSMKKDTSHSVLPLVSVVIPSYNRATLISQTIDSVLAQRYPNIEIIVVDDGSTDNTMDVLRGYGDQIRLIPKKNGGVASSRNVAQVAAQGEYQAWLDCDDICHPDRIAFQVSFMEAHPDVVLCCSDFSSFDAQHDIASSFISSYYSIVSRTGGGIASLFTSKAEVVPPQAWLNGPPSKPVFAYFGQVYHRLLLGNFIHPPTVMIRRSTVDQVGVFDTSLRLGSEYEWSLRASKLGSCALLDAPLLRYRISAEQLSNDRNNGRVRLETLRILDRFREQDPDAFKTNQTELRHRVAECYLGAADAFLDETKWPAFKHLLMGIRYGGSWSKSLKILAKIILPKSILQWKRRHQANV